MCWHLQRPCFWSDGGLRGWRDPADHSSMLLTWLWHFYGITSRPCFCSALSWCLSEHSLRRHMSEPMINNTDFVWGCAWKMRMLTRRLCKDHGFDSQRTHWDKCKDCESLWIKLSGKCIFRSSLKKMFYFYFHQHFFQNISIAIAKVFIFHILLCCS